MRPSLVRGVHRRGHPPEDPAALAQVIAAAASDAAGTEEKGHRAALVALRYTRQVALNAYRDLMNRLLERQHAAMGRA